MDEIEGGRAGGVQIVELRRGYRSFYLYYIRVRVYRLAFSRVRLSTISSALSIRRHDNHE